jgi:hypothetical protein
MKIHGRDSHEKMLSNHPGTEEWIFFQERLELRSNGQERASCVCKILTGQIARLEPLQPYFDLRPPVSVGAECVEQFFMDALRAPSFHPEIFNDESLFLFLIIGSMRYFVRC